MLTPFDWKNEKIILKDLFYYKGSGFLFKSKREFVLTRGHLYMCEENSPKPHLIMPLDYIKALWVTQKNKLGMVFVKLKKKCIIYTR